VSYSNAIQFVSPYSRLIQRLPNHRHNRNHVLPRSKLRDNAPILRVQHSLRSHHIRVNVLPILNHRRRGLVTRRFDS
jgi:hypothetical protein